MNVFFWIVDLIIPITMIIFGILFIKRPPYRINSVYGYRTRRSMASQEAWDYAHQLCGKAWLGIGGILLCFIIVGKLIIPIMPESLSLINTGIGIVALISPMPYIERRLMSRFER